MHPVASQGRIVGALEITTLGYQTLKIGLIAKVFGRKVCNNGIISFVAHQPIEAVNSFHHRELLLLLFSTGKTVIHVIAAKGKLGIADRNDINTLTRFQLQLPVILRHTSDNMVVGYLPPLTNMAILYPDVRIGFRERDVSHSILHKNARMGFPVVVHNLTLVVHQVLKPQR